MTNAKTITNATADQSTSPASALWRIVSSELERASAQFDANWAAYEAAEKAAQAEYPPRLRELQDVWGFRIHMTPSEALEDIADRFIEARERNAVVGRDFTDEEVDAQADEAQRVVGEFFGLVRVYEQIWEKHRVNQLYRAHQVFVAEVYDPAREKLLATPAPDLSAVLFKASVLAVMYDEAEGLEADLQRLLAGGK